MEEEEKVRRPRPAPASAGAWGGARPPDLLLLFHPLGNGLPHVLHCPPSLATLPRPATVTANAANAAKATRGASSSLPSFLPAGAAPRNVALRAGGVTALRRGAPRRKKG